MISTLSQIRKKLDVSISRSYYIAIALIAILATLAFGIISSAINDSEKYAFLINSAGKQRMLTQHIALDAHRFYKSKFLIKETAKQINQKAQIIHVHSKQMLKSHLSLSTGIMPSGEEVKLSSVIKSMYFEKLDLDKRVRYYNELAQSITSSHSQESAALIINEIDKLSDSLMADINQVVSQHQQESENHVNKISNMEMALWLTTLLVLVLELLFIFRPMRKRIEQLFSQTEENIHEIENQNKVINNHLIVSKTDISGRISYVNKRFCEISGYSEIELIGQSHNIISHPEMPVSKFSDIWQTIQSKKTWTGEIRNQNKLGKDYYVLSYIIPILDRQGNIAEYISIGEEITIMVELRESLVASIHREHNERFLAQTANKAKSEFLSSMSHELRTPLNAIIGFSELLKASHLNEKQLRQVQNIHTSGKHLLDLINDVLEYAKIDAGNIPIHTEEISLNAIINETMEIVHSIPNPHQVSLEVADTETDYILSADKTRLKQAILNLFSNAIKYNRTKGAVKLFCFSDQIDNENCIHICIKDTGIGITEDNLKKIFKPFDRLGHETSNIQGTGIGLTITKTLVEKMNGQMKVDSTKGVGSTFEIILPLNSELNSIKAPHLQHNPLPQIEATIPSHRYKKYRIMFIEDNHSHTQLLETIATELDNSIVKIAFTAEEGLEVAKSYKPHLIILDLNLSGLNGDEALPLYRALPELRDVKTQFYATSKVTSDTEVYKARNAGFKQLLNKPIEVDLLKSLINQLDG